MARTLKLLAGLCVLIGVTCWLIHRAGLLRRSSGTTLSKARISPPIVSVTPSVPETGDSSPVAAQTADTSAPTGTPATVAPAQPPASLSDTYPQRTDEVLQVPDIPQDDLGATVSAELAQITPAVSVGDWRKSHPLDTWHRQAYGFSPPGDSFGDYCAVFKTMRRFSNGSRITRRAVFFIPPVPPTRALPDDSAAAGLIENGCILGGIQVELTLGSQENLQVISGQVRDAVSAEFGRAMQEPDPMEPATIRRNPVTAWTKGEATVRLKPESSDAPLLPQDPHPDLTITSYLPNYHDELLDQSRYYPAPDTVATDRQIFELAMRTTALNEKASRPMEDLFRTYLDFTAHENGLTPRHFPVSPEQLAGVLQQWLNASMDLPPVRRAAALLAADFVLDGCWNPIEYESHDLGDQAVKPLEAIGINFDRGGPDGTVTNVTWLEDAYRLDPDGPIGDVLTYMSLLGWPPLTPIETGNASGLTEYDNLSTYLITTGARYLSRPRDPATTAKVEYAIASSYCDRVAFAEGVGDPIEGLPGPPTRQEFELGRGARAEALKHYRAMLAIDKTSTRSLEAWRSAWKLMAGLPLDTHNAHGD
jgi:hypothetical protein